jgi:hypothetical protein
MSEEFKTGDRVKRSGQGGALGTVQKVRVEIVRTTLKEDSNEPPGVTVTVLWDNGTLSHFVPEGLERA